MSEETPPTETLFQRKLRERREAEEAAAAVKAKPSETFDADLVPEDPYERSEGDKALDSAVDRIDIIAAYNKYVGKRPAPHARPGQTESIMCRCPNPAHEDKKPSAWINTDLQTWNCGTCNQGGDAHDFAAWAKGYDVPGYKVGKNFRELREQMAADFGFVAVTLPGGAIMVAEPEPEPISDVPDTVDTSDISGESDIPAPSAPSGDADIIELYDGEDFFIVPPLDWDRIIPKGTFLDKYMQCVKIDDCPDEYHMFHGLVALGQALGRDVTLFDSVPVYGNLFICTLGRSGSGKSKAARYLNQLITKALPYDHNLPGSRGTRRISAPGSAEVLIHNFQKPIADPTNPKVIAYNAPVRGLIEYNELSSLLSRSNRLGSAIKPTLMQFYDMENKVETSSMTTGVKTATEPFASALTSTQPKALKDLLKSSDDSSGFLNRWAFILGTAKKKFAIGGTNVDVTPAVEPLEKIYAWASTFMSSEQILWTQEAADRFTEFFYSNVEPDKQKFDSDLFVRIDLLLKKLILLFTANLMEKRVPLEAVESAIACYDFLLAGYAVPAEQVGHTLASEMQDAIMAVATKQFKINGRGVTLSQLSKSLWRRKYNQETLIRTVEALVKIGFLKMDAPKAGEQGRPTVRYRVAK